jgi:hypothetical protein
MYGFIGIFDIVGYQNLIENSPDTDSAGRILELIAQAREETRESISFADYEEGNAAAVAELERRTRLLVFSDTVVYTIRLDDDGPGPGNPAGEETSTPPGEAFVDPRSFILSSAAEESPISAVAEPVTETPPESEDPNIQIDATLAAMCLVSAVSSASFFQFSMFQAGLPLRGALHFGTYVYPNDDGGSSGLAGPGVEEASLFCESLDLSGIVISPEAYELAGQFCEETEGLSQILNADIRPYLVPMKPRSRGDAQKLATVDWLRGARNSAEYAQLDLSQYVYERFWDHGKDIDADLDPVVNNTIKLLRYYEMAAALPPEEGDAPPEEMGWRPSPPGIDLG